MKTIAFCLKFTISRLRITLRNRGGRCLLILFLIFLGQSFGHAQSPSIPEDASLFHEGEILLSKGDPERALWRFKRLITEFPKSPLIHEAKFRMGICYTQLKRSQDGIRILNELLSTFLSPSRMVQVFSLLGDNYLEQKDRLTALHWYGKGILVPRQPHENLKAKIRSILDTSDSIEELTQIESLYRGAYAGGYAKFRLGQLAKRQGNDVLARKILRELEKEYRGLDYGPFVKDLSESIPPTPKSKYTVGVILPLSGIQQPFGERVLDGIQLAIPSLPPSSQLISLAIRDSKGSPGEAEKAVEELVNKERVIAILGPLMSPEAERAIQKAQQMKVPLLTFTQKEMKGEFCFQNSLIPAEQIQTLLDYAFGDLDLRTFAIFYPNSPYGIYFKNLFSQEVSKRKGKIVGVVAYQEDQTDFSQEIKEFFKIETVQKPDSKKKEEEFKVHVSVDGLFIPDVHDRVGTILSQMAFYDVKGLTFLGNNAWNGPGLISIGGKGAEGAIFVDAFFKRDPSPMVARFVQEFRKAYQRDPEILEALGYDGAKFLKDILQSKLISSPLQLKEEMRHVNHFQGATKLKGFDEEGRPIRSLYLLKVNKGQIEQIVP